MLTSTEVFKLNDDFSPILRHVWNRKENIIIAGGGQLVLMTLFTCAVLFVTITVLHFIFWSIQRTSAPDDNKKYSLPPLWKLFVSSFVMSLALMVQWVLQQVEFWNRNNLFPAFDDDRRSQLISEIIGRMVTYYVDLFAELAMNAVPWAVIAAIIFTLSRRGRGTPSFRPSMGEYRLLGLLFAAVVVTTGSSYVGFAVPITFIVAFFIVGFILPWARRFNRLENILKTIRVRSDDDEKQWVERERKRKRKLPKIPKGPTDLRSQLITQQVRMDALRDRARSLVADLNAGDKKLCDYETERKEIEISLAKFPFPPASATFTADWPGPLSPSVRPANIALAIGPGKGDWWDNGLCAAKIVAVPSILAMAYFSYIEYIKIEDGRISRFTSYFGLLRLLESMVWEVGFWVVAAFVLGCLWRTIPGRRGPIKGAVLWAGFVIPSAIDFTLGRGLFHQDQVDGVLMHALLLLLELLLVGLILDWFTLRDADTFRIHRWQSLATLYGLRGVGPTLSTLLVVVVPLLATVIGIYIQLTSGSTAPDMLRVPPPGPGSTRPGL